MENDQQNQTQQRKIQQIESNIKRQQEEEEKQKVKKQQQKSQNLLQQQQQEQVNQQTVQHFNKICQQATKLMISYKQQSQQLKKQITGMVGIYNQNAGPSNAVPVEQIINITQNYEKGMKQANIQYTQLSKELKDQQQEQEKMIQDVMVCMKKLELLEQKIKLKKAKENQLKNSCKKQQNVKQEQQQKK